MTNNKFMLDCKLQLSCRNSGVAMMMKNKEMLDIFEECVSIVYNIIKDGGNVLLCGNGGSAAQAQHIAAEFVGRFRRDRRPLFAKALTADTSVLTAIANDYGYEHAFARQIESLRRGPGILIALSTSGCSPNILKAVDVAKTKGFITIGLTGEHGGDLKHTAQYWLGVPSNDTAVVQEMHLILLHIMCNFIDEYLFGEEE